MNIMHLNSQFKKGGGLEKILFELLKNNELGNNHLCIINDRYSQEYIDYIPSNKILLCERKEKERNPVKTLLMIKQISNFVINNKIEIIHCHDKLSIKIGYLVKKITKKVKIIFTVHDTMIFTKYLSVFKADKYVAISNAVYKQIRLWVPERKIELIYNGVDLNSYYKVEKQKKINKLTISCVARIDPKIKGQDILIEALNVLKNKYKVNDFRCYFAGEIPLNFENTELFKNVYRYGLQNEVKFLGNIDEIEKIYSESDVVVLPSRHEGLGLVIIEALACNCFPIVSNNEGPLEITKNGEFGMVFEKENHHELADKLFLIINNPDLIENSIEKKYLREYLFENFSLENMFNKYRAEYRSLTKILSMI
ncbi:glycosyltransferase family 4 protein [Exiguobacterium sp. s36]|uniref:glycosyltransferase family 4 protein n=1 Tax=Exiguobacterium sp. s36 TaxID=2751227 RepID=UPI001BE56E81|nr:glycosyltransferase family 4 protein [Exiguobacterium sp. s36]